MAPSIRETGGREGDQPHQDKKPGRSGSPASAATGEHGGRQIVKVDRSRRYPARRNRFPRTADRVGQRAQQPAGVEGDRPALTAVTTEQAAASGPVTDAVPARTAGTEDDKATAGETTSARQPVTARRRPQQVVPREDKPADLHAEKPAVAAAAAEPVTDPGTTDAAVLSGIPRADDVVVNSPASSPRSAVPGGERPAPDADDHSRSGPVAGTVSSGTTPAEVRPVSDSGAADNPGSIPERKVRYTFRDYAAAKAQLDNLLDSEVIDPVTKATLSENLRAEVERRAGRLGPVEAMEAVAGFDRVRLSDKDTTTLDLLHARDLITSALDTEEVDEAGREKIQGYFDAVQDKGKQEDGGPMSKIRDWNTNRKLNAGMERDRKIAMRAREFTINYASPAERAEMMDKRRRGDADWVDEESEAYRSAYDLAERSVDMGLSKRKTRNREFGSWFDRLLERHMD